jgi:hypothetical protein
MLTDDETTTADELRAIRERLGESLRFLASDDDRRHVQHTLSLAIVRATGGQVRTCVECGTTFGVEAARVAEIRAARPRRDLPARCSGCRGLRRHERAERAQRPPY